jgi:hypothetical protein
MWHVCRRKKIHVGVWWVSLKEGDHLEDIGVDGKKLLKWNFKLEWEGWTGVFRLRIR